MRDGSDKELKKSQKIIAMILILLILIYVFYAVYLLIVTPTDTYIIKKGTLSEEETAIGYIIRNEVVVKEDYDNGIYAIASEGKKVANGESIFRYYSDNEKDITNKISELDYKIQELVEQEKKINSADIKTIENQIEEKIVEINKLNNYKEIQEYKKNIENLISKKIKFIGEETNSKEIKQLIKERNSYENQLKKGSEYQKAPISGIVSYRVDGLEEKLSANDFSIITEDYLKEIGVKTGEIIGTSDDSGKVIDNFKCYVAITMNSKSAMNAKVGDSLTLRTADSEENKAKIIQINEEDEKRTIIFQINKMTDNLVVHRKIAVDVIWWSATGLKVPNQALIKEDDDLYYVIRNRAGVQSKILVKVKANTDKSSIITPYSSKELQELGYGEKEIRNYKKINNYDEVILNTEK